MQIKGKKHFILPAKELLPSFMEDLPSTTRKIFHFSSEFRKV